MMRSTPIAAAALLLAAWSTPAQEPLELTLEQALDIALANDLGLQIQALASDVTRFQYEGSWGAFDPVLTATAAVSDGEFESSRNAFFTGASVFEQDTQEFNTNVMFPLTTGGSFTLDFDTVNTRDNDVNALFNPRTNDNLTLSYSQPLLRGAWRSFATSQQREAEILHAKQVEGYRATRQALLLAVHDAYWDLVAAIEELGVAVSTLELGREQLTQNERRLEFGVGTEVEVLQAQATVAQREEERLLAEVNVRATADRLKAMLYPGKDPATWNAEIVPITPLPESVAAPAKTWEESVVIALEQRAELRQQRLEIDAAELRLSRAGSNRKPGLDLNLSSTSRGFDGDSFDALKESLGFGFPTYRGELSFDIPIGNRSARFAVRVERAQVRTARLVYDQLESQVVAEVREAERQYRYEAEAVRAAAVSLDLAQRQLSAEQARYREGLSTNFQVLEFQQQLAAAMSSEKRARVNFAKARAALESAEGVLGENRP